MPLAEAAKLLRARKLDNATAVITLQWLVINRDEVRRKWGAG